MTNRVEPFADQGLSRFNCGNADLDDWLHRHARSATGQGTRTYVLVETDGAVVGYFAVTPHLLTRQDAPPQLARGAPRQIPAVLLAKLAVDVSIQGQGLGSELLVRALATVLTAARQGGGRVVLLDAIDDNARTFYEHHDFRALPDRPDRLVIKPSTVAKALGEPWP